MFLERMRPLFGSFAGKVAIVTGASSGIGKETALSLARLGAKVALLARRADLLAEVAAQAEGQTLALAADVTDPKAVRAAVHAVKRKWGRIDCLINNAGVLVPGEVATLKLADLEAMLRVNLFGALLMTQAVLPSMQRGDGGCIVNVASLAGRRGISPLGGYCATKFALVGLTEALRTEVDAKIHVGLVLPGVVDTPMAVGVEEKALAPLWPQALNMPPQWVVVAILLAIRFRLREISVPPGAATLEILGSLAPGVTDTLIAWSRAAYERLGSALRPSSPQSSPTLGARASKRTRQGIKRT